MILLTASEVAGQLRLTQLSFGAALNGLINLERSVVHIIQSRHEISNNVVCAMSKTSDRPVHMHSLIRVFVTHLNIL